MIEIEQRQNLCNLPLYVLARHNGLSSTHCTLIMEQQQQQQQRDGDIALAQSLENLIQFVSTTNGSVDLCKCVSWCWLVISGRNQMCAANSIDMDS